MPDAASIAGWRGSAAMAACSRFAGVTAVALGVFALVLLAAGKDPIAAYENTFRHTLASAYGASELLVRMTPLLLAAVAVALPARLGLINVGGEGQFYMGAFMASAAAFLTPQAPAWLLLPFVALAGFAGGALWAAIPGFLRAARLVNETVATLLLNYVAPLVVSYFVYGPWRTRENSAYPESARFADAALLPSFFGTRVHAGLLVALAALAIYWVVIEKTRWGLEMRAIGGNPEAAQRLGVPVPAWIVAALAIGGGFAGLAGMGEAMGIAGRLREGLSPGYGYTGFLIAWLAGGRPLGILFMAFLFAIITSAGDSLQISQGVPYATVNILLAATLFVVLARRTSGMGK
ncbi:ABC transporter permease [Caenimonas aquaedulcis]|uniref:ABC transporter permease n=1 Tax=Caenimonas aquaedulcis TaxID=2793270 RepID=A0A931H7E6_9BURK|nr:ABC transporter permease [Caenimonas aquaedulcis]MBG9390051.1 ABC transporter permease [Caenimonas aquaedulcis]